MGRPIDGALAHFRALGTRHIDVQEWLVPIAGGRVLDAALAHYKALGSPSFVVPEWGDLRIFYQPLTIAARMPLAKADNLAIVVARAKDEAGAPLFDADDEQKMKRAVSAQIVDRIADELFGLPAVRRRPVADTKPLRVYYQPLTLLEREQILAGDTGDQWIMISKALDAEGRPLFSADDERSLIEGASFHVINRIARTMFSLPQLDAETDRKN